MPIGPNHRIHPTEFRGLLRLGWRKIRDLEFLRYEFLDTESLLAHLRYRERSRQVFDVVIDLALTMAKNNFALHCQNTAARGRPAGPVAGGQR